MTLARMLVAAFAARAVAALVAAVFLLALADFSELASSISAQPDSVSLALRLYLHKLPFFVVQALPLALLFGVLLAVADLARSGELDALRLAGAGALRVALPGILVAAVLTGGVLWLGDAVAPASTREVVEIQTRTLWRWTWYWTVFHKRRSWFAGEGDALYRVRSVRDGGEVLDDVTRYDHRDGRLSQLAQAPRLLHRDGWIGAWKGARVDVWDLEDDDPATVRHRRGEMPIDEPPSHFAGILGQPDELRLSELRTAIELRRRQGQVTLPLEVEVNNRLAMPSLGFALALLALGLGLGARAPASHTEAAVVGIGIAFVGWTLVSALRALGLAGVVGPAVAVWTPVALIALVGLALLWRGR